MVLETLQIKLSMIPELFGKIEMLFIFIGNEDPVSDIDSNNGIKLVI